MEFAYKVVEIDGHKLSEPIAVRLSSAEPTWTAGMIAFANQSKIPHYDPRKFYVLECEGKYYDIDAISWIQVTR